MSISEEFISVADFALLTGLAPAQIEGRYTVQVGNRKLVPRFMIAGHALPEVAHIELLPCNTQRSRHGDANSQINHQALNGNVQPEAAVTPVYLKDGLQAAEEAQYHPIASLDMPVQVLPEKPTLTLPQEGQGPQQDQLIASLERDAFELDDVLTDATQLAIAKDSTQEASTGSHRSGKVYSRSELGLMVHPFSRLVARSLDLTWESVALVFVLLGLMQSLDSNLVVLFQTPLALAALGIMIAPLTLLLDAIVYGLFKNTPGKYLMGLRVVSKRLRTLKFTKYLRRNFRMWGRVLGYGIVPLALFYMIREGFRIRRGLETNYDQAGRTRVGKKLNSRTSTFTLAAAAGAALLYALVLAGVVDAETLKSVAANYLPAFVTGSD